jgi:hypothetical protein
MIDGVYDPQQARPGAEGGRRCRRSTRR